MKKIKKILLLLVITLSVGGCFKRDSLEKVDINTTTYPVEYIMERLYGYNSQVMSIYPDEINVNEYSLTQKQIENFSEIPLFVYNGLTEEKEVARKLINENEEVQIIDVSYGLKIINGPEELWLSPNNYLMLATNAKNSLQEFISNKFIIEEIEKNFEKLEEELSLMDAELRSVASISEEDENNVIVVNDPIFNFLNGYGFQVINTNDKDLEITNLEDNFKNETYKYILVRDDMKLDEKTSEYIDKYKLEVIKVDIMSTLDETQRKENDNYMSIMNDFIENIKKVTSISN